MLCYVMLFSVFQWVRVSKHTGKKITRSGVVNTHTLNMAALSELLLTTLTNRETFDTLTLSSELSVEHEKIVGAVKSLQAKGDVRRLMKYCIMLSNRCYGHMGDEICRKERKRFLHGVLIFRCTLSDIFVGIWTMDGARRGGGQLPPPCPCPCPPPP